MLRRRVVTTSLLVAIPAALILAFAVDRWRAHDLRVALEGVVRSQVNDQLRDRCEADPTWFSTGPLDGRPKRGDTVDPNPDALKPRARYVAQPFELFAYDEAFLGSSTAAPRFPLEFRRSLLAANDSITGSYASPVGDGYQMGVATGWKGGPCVYLLARMQPSPHVWGYRLLSVLGFFAVAFAVALAALEPTLSRVLRFAAAVRGSVSSGHTPIAPDETKDELSSLMFVYNDTANGLHERDARIGDQDVALKQFVRAAADDVSQPLATLESVLGEIQTGAVSGATAAARVREALVQSHDLGARMANLTAAAQLRLPGDVTDKSRVDISELVTRVVARHQGFAHARQVMMTLNSRLTGSLVTTTDESLFERALSNVIDNAIRYNVPNGRVTVSLARSASPDRFAIVVSNSGQEMTDEDVKLLATPKRFRGDEARNRRPGWRGLGLAVTQEALDRLGYTLDVRRSSDRGLEAEIAGPVQ